MNKELIAFRRAVRDVLVGRGLSPDTAEYVAWNGGNVVDDEFEKCGAEQVADLLEDDSEQTEQGEVDVVRGWIDAYFGNTAELETT